MWHKYFIQNIYKNVLNFKIQHHSNKPSVTNKMKFLKIVVVIFVVFAAMFIAQSEARPGWLEDFGKEIVSIFILYLKNLIFKFLIN